MIFRNSKRLCKYCCNFFPACYTQLYFTINMVVEKQKQINKTKNTYVNNGMVLVAVNGLTMLYYKQCKIHPSAS